jgi:hypothetical protein
MTPQAPARRRLAGARWLAASIAPGCAVSFLLAPHDATFLPNFAFYWGGQLAVIATLFLARPRVAAVAAQSVVTAAILMGLAWWIRHRTQSHPDGLVWLIYPVLLCGAAIGGVVATWWYGENRSISGVRIACITAIAAAGGSWLSTVAACHSIFYCH